jgi:hypothetical protein
VSAVEVPSFLADLDELATARPACILKTLSSCLSKGSLERWRIEVGERGRNRS